MQGYTGNTTLACSQGQLGYCDEPFGAPILEEPKFIALKDGGLTRARDGEYYGYDSD